MTTEDDLRRERIRAMVRKTRENASRKPVDERIASAAVDVLGGGIIAVVLVLPFVAYFLTS